MREGGPISLSAIGRQDVTVETAPEAARRREARRHDIENVRGEGEYDEGLDDNEEIFEEKINEGEEAWREGDNIIIEDESGEVIRTITSPEQHHTDVAGEKFGQGAMEKISRLESKAEEEVGGITGRLKRMWSGSSRQEPPEKEQRPRDLEKGIPEGEEDTVITRKTSSTTTDSPKRSPPRASSGPSFVVDDANRRTGHVSDSMQRRAREEREEETEVERRRREAVLGAQQDDDYRPAVSRNKGKQPESSSDEDDDEEEEPIPSSQSQSSSGRAESSGSGNQLLSPPLRARGIRFGEINVGQESFALEDGPPSTGARHHKTGSGDWRVRWSNK
jgi:Alkali metal cation/H+ antiporter Nha1 C terminus